MNYYKIIKDDVLNGNGFRTTLVITGCQFNCKGCHAQHLKSPNKGQEFTEETKQAIFNELSKSHISGLSIFGGEITHPNNIKGITKLVKETKKHFPEKDIWCWTGQYWNDIKHEEFTTYIDILIDEPFVLSKRDLSLHYRGSSNQNIIDVQESLKQNRKILAKQYYEED